jgi:hypothetical protein
MIGEKRKNFEVFNSHSTMHSIMVIEGKRDNEISIAVLQNQKKKKNVKENKWTN